MNTYGTYNYAFFGLLPYCPNIFLLCMYVYVYVYVCTYSAASHTAHAHIHARTGPRGASTPHTPELRGCGRR